MTKLELGSIGVAVAPGEGDVFLDATAELAELGYATIWLAGGPLKRLEQIGDVVDATRDVQIASGIISVDRFDREAVAAAYAEIQARHPGRFILGLGGAHGPRPLRTLAGYLDALDALVAWGDLEAVRARVAEHLRAGADQVALSVLSAAPPGSLPVQQWRQLASGLVS